MAIYKTRWFDRWARKQGVGNLALCAAVREMTDGLYEADLGGGLLEKRIARAGEERRFPHAGGHAQGQPMEFRVWLPEERAQQHRQGRRGSLEDVGRALAVADGDRAGHCTKCR